MSTLSDCLNPCGYCINDLRSDEVAKALKDFINDLDESKLFDGMVHINYIKEVMTTIFGERLLE